MRIIYTNEEGLLGVMYPSFGKTLEQFLQDVPKGVDHESVEDTYIPNDETFRRAWVHDKTDSPQKISVNVALARDISLARVRANRETLFAVLDKDYVIAQRTGADTSELDTKRLTLLAATDDLKSLDINNYGLISIEDAAELLLPLERIK